MLYVVIVVHTSRVLHTHVWLSLCVECVDQQILTMSVHCSDQIIDHLTHFRINGNGAHLISVDISIQIISIDLHVHTTITIGKRTNRTH